MKESIKIITNHLKEFPDRLLTGWVFNGTSMNGYYLVNRTFLTVAGIFNGVPKAFRIPGAIEYKDEGDRALFSGNLVRIKDGSRKGVLIPVYQVREDEDVSKVGLGKHLVAGDQAHKISGRRDGDVIFLQTLLDMCNEASLQDELRIPQVYLSVNAGRRESVRTRDLSVPVDTPPMDQEIPGKLIYPYDKFYGHGVCIVKKLPWMDEHDLLKPDSFRGCDRRDVCIDVLEYMNDF